PGCWLIGLCILLLSRFLIRRALDCFDNFHVSGAAAQISSNGLFDVLPRRAIIFVQQKSRGYQHPWSADPTLRATALEHCLLHWIQPAITGKPLDCSHPRALNLTRRDQARVDELAVENDRAGATFPLAAAFLCPG